MKKITSIMMTLILVLTISAMTSICVFAAETDSVQDDNAAMVTETEANENNVLSVKAIAAAIVVAVVGASGAIGMAAAISKSAESMARQPEAAGKINSAMMLGMVFIETAIIYALIVAILIIFVL